MKSRIVPTLTPGSIATDPRSCVHYIVTEYGMVNLKGLSTWERAEALISICRPWTGTRPSRNPAGRRCRRCA